MKKEKIKRTCGPEQQCCSVSTLDCIFMHVKYNLFNSVPYKQAKL